MQGVSSVLVESKDFSEGHNIQTAAFEELFLCPIVNDKWGRNAVIRHIDSKYYPEQEEALYGLLGHIEAGGQYLAEPFSREVVDKMIQVSTETLLTQGLPWALYKIYRVTTQQLLGVISLDRGFSADQNVEGPSIYRGVYQVSQEQVDIRIRDFFVCGEGEREELYRKLVITALGAVVNFSGLGGKLEGKQVTRVTIQLPLIASDVQMPEEVRQEIGMRRKVLNQLFGRCLGVLLPKSRDARNPIGFVQEVYGSDVKAIKALKKRNSLWDDE